MLIEVKYVILGIFPKLVSGIGSFVPLILNTIYRVNENINTNFNLKLMNVW